jgi:hypothetical protein
MFVGSLIVLLVLDIIWIANAMRNAPVLDDEDLSFASERTSR